MNDGGINRMVTSPSSQSPKLNLRIYKTDSELVCFLKIMIKARQKYGRRGTDYTGR